MGEFVIISSLNYLYFEFGLFSSRIRIWIKIKLNLKIYIFSIKLGSLPVLIGLISASNSFGVQFFDFLSIRVWTDSDFLIQVFASIL